MRVSEDEKLGSGAWRRGNLIQPHNDDREPLRLWLERVTSPSDRDVEIGGHDEENHFCAVMVSKVPPNPV